MALDIDTQDIPDSPSAEPDEQEEQQESQPDVDDAKYAQIGMYAPFDYTTEPFVELNEDEREAIRKVVENASRDAVASRRLEVSQTWEAQNFERGYQHNLPTKGGGWEIPGSRSLWGPLAIMDSSGLYSTNTYGRDRDIIVGALGREIPKVVFFPSEPQSPASISASDAANKFKYIFEKNSNLRQVLMDLGDIYYTDGRAILYTRHVLDAKRFGTGPDGAPKGCELTTVFGKLENKVPMLAKDQANMAWIQTMDELDISMARAKYPWIASKINAGTYGIGELEFDKLARINSKLALLGMSMTGDTISRYVTEQYTWMRPQAFFDIDIKEEIRESLLDKFPDGALAVYAGTELAFIRNENVDNHLVVSHPMPGKGQNRRALGTNGISVQKRLNAWLEIMDRFFRNTIPRKHYNENAFDVDALQDKDVAPGDSGGFLPQPGQSSQDLVFVEPTPQSQPALPEFIQLFFGDVSQSLSGALPSIYGGDTDTETATGMAMQRDQALGRIGIAWNASKTAFAKVFYQAVLAAADCRDTDISEFVPGHGRIDIPIASLRDSVLCYPEYDSAFPESWREREARYTEVVNGAAQNPFYAQLLTDTRNMRSIADNVRMGELHIPGEDSVKKQLAEIELMKQTGPQDNPKLLMAQQQLDQIKQGAAAHVASGQPIPPEASQMLQQADQAVQQIPPQVSSVPVAQDKSENHEVEAKTCFDWMNSEEGQKFKAGLPEQQAAYENVHLHWQAHVEMAEKLAPPTEGKPPSVSIPFEKMPPNAQAQALQKAGIQSTPQELSQNKLIDTQHAIAKAVVPKAIPETFRKLSREPEAQ